jgi:glycosyltransferase involved in cell wall biosynthesis
MKKIKSTLPITIIVCTLNEEKNILNCIDTIFKNNIDELIIIDGNSTDNTINLISNLKNNKIRTFNLDYANLIKQRFIGANKSKNELIGYVDADDRLEPECFQKLNYEMIKYKASSVTAQVECFEKSNFWQKNWGKFTQLRKGVKYTNMTGRPCLIKKSILLSIDFDEKFFFACEDTHISIELEKKGYIQLQGTGVSRRIFPDNFNDIKKKLIIYGKGYRQIVKKYPEKKKSIYKHIFFKILIQNNLKFFIKFDLPAVLFNLIYFYFCFVGFYNLKKNN